jgi:hypothetical protein
VLRPALLVSAGAAALAWLLGGGNGHPGYDGAFALDAAAQLEAGRASG